MPAQPAREIIRVKDIDGVTTAIVKGHFGTDLSIPITQLPRTELIRAASMVFPAGSRPWTRYDNVAIQNAITTKSLPMPIDPEPFQPGAPFEVAGDLVADVDQETDEVTLSPTPIPTPALTNGNVPNGSVIESAIRAIAEAAAQSSINETRVREIVSESFDPTSLATLIQSTVDDSIKSLRPHNTIIAIPNHDPKTLPGQQHNQFPVLLKLVALRRNVYLVGPPGTGKTYMAHEACKALDVPFGAISCSPTMPDSRIFGYMDATGRYVSTVFRDRFEHGGGFLFDEADNGHPGVLAAINQALANSQCAFPDGMIPKHPDFFAIMAGNTYGTGATRQFIGRNELDAATLDRFVFLEIPIDEELEAVLVAFACPGDTGESWLAQVRKWRANVQRASLTVAITPRTAVNGALMLAAGFTVDQATAMCARKGLSDDQWRKVNL